MKSNPVSPARLAAFQILRRVGDGAYASVLLAASERKLKAVDRALCYELVLGVLRRQLWLDRLIERYAGRKVAELDPAVRVVLRLGLYQLRFLSRVPASAAVNESVNLIHSARLRSAGALVNAVLRRATREPEIDPTSNLDDPLERLSVATSHPQWLIERWTRSFGAEETEAFARANNEPAPVAFRVVKNRAEEAEVCERLRAAGAELVPSQVAGGAWRVTGTAGVSPAVMEPSPTDDRAATLAGEMPAVPISSVNGVLAELAAAGQIYLQDEASQLVAGMLDVRPGQRVLDLCAAPGSKTTQIADLAGDSALVVAADLHKHRLNTVISSARLQGLANIHCAVVDGLQRLPFRERSFERVLVDAPCSGTGTLRRNPEIRWRISPADIEDLARRQRDLLFNAARAVKPAGRLIYSTCSVETDEDEAVVKTFLENNENFVPAPWSPEMLLNISAGALRTWPHREGTDGFFICAFTRKGR
ncbi:MAG TPA: 16S rRNA (cytosine(967)-C(5))-methyltransferase RsmB [Pyrinomonadaceae bacterium]|nr:16S rRNA (cytosine(967)-C(5))-methyltransferase RsmB [Pyrinomonadaceae bacterium]